MVKEIESGRGPERAVAVTRLLTARVGPKDAELRTQVLGALLDFAPFAEDEWVADEVLASVARLGVLDGPLHPLMQTGLKSTDPERRATAAFNSRDIDAFLEAVCDALRKGLGAGSAFVYELGPAADLTVLTGVPSQVLESIHSFAASEDLLDV